MASVRQQGGIYTRTLIAILLYIIDRTASGGATLQELRGVYADVQGKWPSGKTIQRAIFSLNAVFNPGLLELSREDDRSDPFWAGHDKAICYEKGNRDGKAGVYRFTKHVGSGFGIKGIKKDSAALALYAQSKFLGENDINDLLHGMSDLLEDGQTGKLSPEEIRNYVYVAGSSPQELQRHLRHIFEILRACRNRLSITFYYPNLHEKNGEIHLTVNPYGLLVKQGDWYVVGQNAELNVRRLYRIDHIQKLQIQEGRVFRRPENFAIDEEYQDSWGVWTIEGKQKIEQIVLKVDAMATYRFRHKKYHHSQKLIEKEDGGIVTFHVAGAIEMVPWIMGWGSHVQVLEPEWLRDEVVKGIRSLCNGYGLSVKKPSMVKNE